MIVEVFLIGWLLGGLVANIITIIVQKAKYKVRINKAIEHLELYTNRLLNQDIQITPIETRYILDILKGDEKNENE